MDLQKIITGSVVTILLLIGTFYIDWSIDESQEEQVMFDSPQQKDSTIRVVKRYPSESQEREKFIFDSLEKNIIIQKLDNLTDHLKHMDSVSNLNADQIFQIKEEIKNGQR